MTKKRPNLSQIVDLEQLTLVALSAHCDWMVEKLPSTPPSLLLSEHAWGVDRPGDSLIEGFISLRLRAQPATEPEEDEEVADSEDTSETPGDEMTDEETPEDETNSGEEAPVEKRPPFEVEARFRILYRRPADFTPTEDEVNEFLAVNGVFNVWPFWRELTSSVFQRVEIPFPPIPLYRIDPNKGTAKQKKESD